MPPASPSPTLFHLPDDILQAIVAAFDEFDLHRLARLAKAGRAIVQAHRCGVVLPLQTRRPSQREFLHAFGLSLSEIAPLYDAPKVGGAKPYDLSICLPLVLRSKGGWRGIKAAQDAQMQAAVKKRKRADAAAAERAMRRTRVDAALVNMRIDGGVDGFCRKLTLHGYDRGATEALSSFLKTGCNFEAVVIALARSAVLMQRHRELATVLDALDQQSDPRYWSEEMRTYVATGKGSARKLLSIQPRFWRLHV